MKHITEDIGHGNVCKALVAYSNYDSKRCSSFSIKMDSRKSKTVLKQHCIKLYKIGFHDWYIYKYNNELMAQIGAWNVVRMHFSLGALEPCKLSKCIRTAFQ